MIHVAGKRQYCFTKCKLCLINLISQERMHVVNPDLNKGFNTASHSLILNLALARYRLDVWRAIWVID